MIHCPVCNHLCESNTLACPLCHTPLILNGVYRVTDRLGKNTFDAVYLAEDMRTHTTVVVQEIEDDAGASSEQFLASAANFRAEAMRLQQINHPGLACVLDSFSNAHRHYLITEYVAGETLEDRLASAGALPESQVLQWAIELCDALNYLHTRTPPIIHSDIKPTNIKFMSDGHVKLIGYGIARALVTESSTERGVTPPYSPLEQYGKQRAGDVRSDIYALGVMLYRLTTNHLPPAAAQRSTQPLMPPRCWNPALSEQLESVILKAIAEEAGRRYQSALQLKQALQGVTPVAAPVKPAVPIATTVPPPATPSTKPASKSNIKLLAAIGFLIVGILGLTLCGVVVWGVIELNRQQQATATARAQATGTAVALTTATAVARATATANAQAIGTRMALLTATSIAQATTNAQATATNLARDRATMTARAQATMLAQGTATAQARLTSTAMARAATQTRASPAWRILLSDTFDTNMNQWRIGDLQSDFGTSTHTIANGTYRWDMKANQSWIRYHWPAMSSITDFELTVEGRRVSGSTDSDWGVIFRRSEKGFYTFEIRNTLFVVRRFDGNWTTLINWSSSTALRPDGWNQIKVIGKGSQFEFFANGQRVGGTNDSVLTSGVIGLAVTLYETGDEAIVEFDNLELRIP